LNVSGNDVTIREQNIERDPSPNTNHFPFSPPLSVSFLSLISLAGWLKKWWYGVGKLTVEKLGMMVEAVMA
jgi:hypothetical protein